MSGLGSEKCSGFQAQGCSAMNKPNLYAFTQVQKAQYLQAMNNRKQMNRMMAMRAIQRQDILENPPLPARGVGVL